MRAIGERILLSDLDALYEFDAVLIFFLTVHFKTFYFRTKNYCQILSRSINKMILIDLFFSLHSHYFVLTNYPNKNFPITAPLLHFIHLFYYSIRLINSIDEFHPNHSPRQIYIVRKANTQRTRRKVKTRK